LLLQLLDLGFVLVVPDRQFAVISNKIVYSCKVVLLLFLHPPYCTHIFLHGNYDVLEGHLCVRG
jgi:hypothetical protein